MTTNDLTRVTHKARDMKPGETITRVRLGDDQEAVLAGVLAKLVTEESDDQVVLIHIGLEVYADRLVKVPDVVNQRQTPDTGERSE